MSNSQTTNNPYVKFGVIVSQRSYYADELYINITQSVIRTAHEVVKFYSCDNYEQPILISADEITKYINEAVESMNLDKELYTVDRKQVMSVLVRYCRSLGKGHYEVSAKHLYRNFK